MCSVCHDNYNNKNAEGHRPGLPPPGYTTVICALRLPQCMHEDAPMRVALGFQGNHNVTCAFESKFHTACARISLVSAIKRTEAVLGEYFRREYSWQLNGALLKENIGMLPPYNGSR